MKKPTGRPRRPCRFCGGLDRTEDGRDCVNAECRRARCGENYRRDARRRIDRNRVYRRSNPDVNRRAAAKWRASNCAKRMLGAARARAARHGIDFTITLDHVLVPAACPILGTPIAPGRSGCGRGYLDDSPSLDRVDNARGYVPGNVAVISGRANKIKNCGTADEHRRIAEWMTAHFDNARPEK